MYSQYFLKSLRLRSCKDQLKKSIKNTYTEIPTKTKHIQNITFRQTTRQSANTLDGHCGEVKMYLNSAY